MTRTKDKPLTQVTFHATVERITNAIMNCKEHCMISDSVRDALPGSTRVQTDRRFSYFTYKGLRYRAPLSTLSVLKLEAFDKGKPIAAFTSTLEIDRVRPAGYHGNKKNLPSIRAKHNKRKQEGKSKKVSKPFLHRQYGMNLSKTENILKAIEEIEGKKENLIACKNKKLASGEIVNMETKQVTTSSGSKYNFMKTNDGTKIREALA